MNSAGLKDAAKLARAEFRFKRGRKAALSLLLDISDLPGQGWKLNTFQTLRAGIVGKVDDIAKRARQARCVAVWGTFTNKSTRKKILIQITPAASPIDADARTATFEQRNIEGIARFPIIGNTRVEPSLDMLGVGHVPGIEYEIVSGKSSGRNHKRVGGNVGNVVYSISCSGFRGGWSWEEVLQVADSQRRKLMNGGELAASMKKRMRIGDIKFVVWLIVVAIVLTLWLMPTGTTRFTGVGPEGVQSRGGADYSTLASLGIGIPSGVTRFVPLSRAQAKSVNVPYGLAMADALLSQNMGLPSGVNVAFDEGSFTNSTLGAKNIPAYIIVFSGSNLPVAAHTSSNISKVVVVINAISGVAIYNFMVA
jgi:hypothetical protein